MVAWINTLTDLDEKNAMNIAMKCQQLGCNTHSLHLIAFFGEEYIAASNVNVKLEESGTWAPPSYLSMPSDSSISKQDLILQQCVQGIELSWEDADLGFFTLDFLLMLVETYYQPLKLLATIPCASLFHLLESATKERYLCAVEVLARHLRPFSDKEVTISNQIVMCKCW